jgi:hypothetical protein
MDLSSWIALGSVGVCALSWLALMRKRAEPPMRAGEPPYDDTGVREPRRPKPLVGAGANAKDPEE